MSPRGNIILFCILALFVIFILIFCLTYKKEVVQVENVDLTKNERLCEIIDSNNQVIKWFVGDIDYIEKETYVEIIKRYEQYNDTIIILPHGTIRFFNVPLESEEDNDEKNIRK